MPAAAGTRTVKVRFTGDNKGLSRAAGSAGRSVGGFGKALGGLKKAAKIGATAVAAVGVAAVALAPKLIDMASNLELMGKKAAAVFEGELGRVEKWAKRNGKAMGLTSREAVGLAANFADLLKPMGFNAKQATDMSTKVLGLSGALAEWSGGTRTAAEVSEILSKAMLGERESLKSLGISITEADVQARLAKKGQEDLTGAALEQAKAIATQELIFEKSTDAQKAFKDGGDSLARTMAGAKATAREWAQDMVVKLTPAIKTGAKWVQEKIVPAVQQFAAWVNDKVVPALQQFAGWVQEHVVPQLRKLGNYLSETVIPILQELAETYIERLKVAFTDIKKTVKDNEDQLRQFGDGLKKVIDFIVTKVIPVLGPAMKRTSRVLITAIQGVILWISFWIDRWNQLWRVTSNVVGKVKGAVSGLKSFFSAVDVFSGFRQSFKDALNWIIDRWNGLSFTLPSISAFGKTVGGGTISTPDIPRLHSGGVFRAPPGRGEGLALLRDQERVLTPEQQAGTHVDQVIVQAWSDRFSWPQVERELAMHGVT